MSAPRLAGTVVVMAVAGGAAVARRFVEEGATVVLTGTGGDEAGRVLASLGQGPGRVAYYEGEVNSDAFVEFIGEQFAERPPVS
jgi:NAD(P)-dependent dehydrogenase (short-subunit alcohol dehydrogenase family)